MKKIDYSLNMLASLILTVFLGFPLYAAEPPDRFMVEAQNILDQIKEKNKDRNGYMSLFLGVMQISTPQAVDPIKLNSQSIVPVAGVDGDLRLIDEFGLNFKFTHAQNMLLSPTTDSPNSSSSAQDMLEATLRYKFILDQTSVKNYVMVRAGGYLMSNNFELFTDDPSEKPNNYMKSITGIMAGVERSIPATPQWDVRGGLDLIYTIDSESETTVPFKTKGSGFQFKGEVYYNFKLFGASARWGGGYTLGAFFNKISFESDQESKGKTSFAQSYRTLTTILSILY